MEYELYHHGIKGMRWGIRRYQNADGSLTKAGQKRLDKYKTEELDKIVDKYKVEKLTKQRDKLERKALTKGGLFIDNRLAKAQYRVYKASAMEFMESNKVYSMSYEDMMSERAALRKARGKTFISGLGRKAVGLVIGESAGDIFVDSDVFKTNRRVGLEESVRNDYEARKVTGYRGLY
jgi:hypothetical protein